MYRIIFLTGDSKKKKINKERKEIYRVNIIHAHEKLNPYKMTKTTLYQIQKEK